MRYTHPDSKFQRSLFETHYLNVFATKIFPKYRATIEGGLHIILRSESDDDDIVKEIFGYRQYERFFRPEGGETIVDAGANIGCFTLRAWQLIGDKGLILAFEPSSESYSLMLENVKLNNIRNVKMFKCALGERSYRASLKVYNKTGRNSIFPPEEDDLELKGTELVEVKTLDQILLEQRLTALDLVKIDTEGSELNILRGAENALRKFSPKIVGEAHPLVSDSAGAILEYLKDFGYQGKIAPYYEDELFFAWVGPSPR